MGGPMSAPGEIAAAAAAYSNSQQGIAAKAAGGAGGGAGGGGGAGQDGGEIDGMLKLEAPFSGAVRVPGCMAQAQVLQCVGDLECLRTAHCALCLCLVVSLCCSCSRRVSATVSNLLPTGCTILPLQSLCYPFMFRIYRTCTGS